MMNMNNLAQTHEILTPQLATKVGLTKFEFYKYVKANEYEQVRHGVYAAKDTWIDELEMLHRRCPMGLSFTSYYLIELHYNQVLLKRFHRKKYGIVGGYLSNSCMLLYRT